MIYKVKKGRHNYKPYRLNLICKPAMYEAFVVMEIDNAYTLPGADQWDWNKGGGWSETLTSNHKRAAMWGWRWNPESKKFELTYYVHDNGKIKKGDNNFFEVEPGHSVLIAIYRHLDHFVYFFTSDTAHKFMVVKLDKVWRPAIGREINPWFGGNNSAPADLKFLITYKKIR